MNTEEDEFKRIESEAKRREQDDDDDTQGYADTLTIVYQNGYKAGALAEREECAKIADGWPDYDVQGLAEAIRARGTT